MKTYKNIYLLGDIHGSYAPIYNLNRRVGGIDNCLVILLGDAGLNFWLDDRDIINKKRLCKYYCDFFVIRGNHEQRPSILAKENPDKWEIKYMFDAVDSWVYIEKKFPNIIYAQDMPALYTINNYNVLTIGGAYSVDKYYRLQHDLPWFEQEQATKEEFKHAEELWANNDIDLVLTHTCPIYYEPTDLFLSVVDQSMVDKTMERELGYLEYTYDYKAWCWGHYHAFREYPRGDIISPEPSYINPRRVMLFNDYALELENLMNDAELRKI